ncbi:ComEA family DNA-binding protein [Streptomyces sp. YS415]|uniref:ComEA family DNA-binding protein n=1 Tax=Streptomyces sp. YS415 TaxID=2944806 RepID=UPI0020221C64|nr:ComEA family DNA-binding protein [Streptomyces sp. YS415]MCL7427013.1 ComEA family DNA-binding protein [Streptomyces sp. YS415]
MALRSRTRTAAAASGPGRGPRSDVRTRHHRTRPRGRARHRHAPAEELRRRAELLFGERALEGREPGEGPSRQEDEGGPDPGAPGADPAGDWRGRAGLALRERLPVWMQARCGLERRSLLALTVVLVVAAGFAVQHFWTGRTQDVRAPEVVRAASWAAGERSAEPGAGLASASAGTEIVVDVSGKVREPGIHRLPPGSRVDDALRAAGGVRPGASTAGLNRARFLVDGEQVVVGAPAPVQGGAPAPGPAGAASTAPVSLNTATPEQLDTLPGVGPVLAQHIIDHRTRNGGFRSVEELREVNGIGERRFADLRNLVRP